MQGRHGDPARRGRPELRPIAATRRQRQPQGATMPNSRTGVTPSAPRQRASPADPCAMVIFGAGGDLTKRLVVPALYNLSRTDVLPENFALIGVDLAPGTADSWRDHLHDTLKSFVGNAAAEFHVERIEA